MLRTRLILAAVMAPALLAAGASAADTPTDPAQEAAALRYRECVTAVETDAAKAVDLASRWRDVGGGIPAKHCLGLALFETGKAKNAAVAFSQAAADLESGKSQLLGGPIRYSAATVAALYGQAGNASLVADDPASAYQHFSRALKLLERDAGPQRGNLLIDRARSLAGMKDFKLAKADLDKAIADLPNSIDAWLLRAAAHRQLGQTAAAKADVEKAVQLAPTEPDVLLERATLLAREGDITAAEADWARIVELAPESAAAQTARANLGQGESSGQE